MQNIKILVRFFLLPIYVLRIFFGILNTKRKSYISEKQFQAMINLFLLTGGWSNDLISYFLKSKKNEELENIKYRNKNLDSKYISNEIKKSGFFIIKNFLSAKECKQILEYSLKIKGRYRGDKIKIRNKKKFNRANPKGPVFYYDESDVIDNSIVQNLITNKFLLSISQNYFDTPPILSASNLWWSSFINNRADSEAAQIYHFDMDSLKWLKFFIYLSDVNTKNGPHTFIKKSHKNNGIPWELRSKGYSRLNDHELENHYSKGQFIEFAEKKGTLLIEDTRGLHKGKPLSKGDRLILQLEYTNSAFIKKKNIKLKKKTSLNLIKKTNNILMKLYN